MAQHLYWLSDSEWAAIQPHLPTGRRGVWTTGVAMLLDRIETPKRLLADRAYDARRLRDWLAVRGCEAVIPTNPSRKHPNVYDKTAYRGRNVVEPMFCRLKDFRRIATRYDKRDDIFLSAIFIIAAIVWWTN